MKKIGWYLMSVVPLIVMFVVQVFVATVMMLGWMLSFGYEGGMQAYEDNYIVLVRWMHLITLLITGLWYYLYVVRRQKRAGIPLAGIFTGKSFGSTVMLAFGAQLLVGLLLTVWQLAFPEMIAEYNQLMEEFWDFDSSATSRTVDVYMSKLREKTAVCDGFEIVTVHGLGYKAVLK